MMRQTGHPRDLSNDETITYVSTLREDHRFTFSDIHREMTQCYLTQTAAQQSSAFLLKNWK